MYQRRSLEEAVVADAENLELEAIQRSENVKHGDKLKLVTEFINLFNIEDPNTALKCRELCRVYFDVKSRTTF